MVNEPERDDPWLANMLERIAELEAERLMLHDKWNECARELGIANIEHARHIAELEAERDRLQADVEASARHANALSYRMRSAEAERDRLKAALTFIARLHGKEAETARAALSDPSGETKP